MIINQGEKERGETFFKEIKRNGIGWIDGEIL